MKAQRNPIHKSGHKNVFCPFYEQCLDAAVRRRWKCWDCSACPQKAKEESLSEAISLQDSSPYYTLPPGIYRQVIYGSALD